MIKRQQRINKGKRYRNIKIIQNNQKSKSLVILKKFQFHILSYIKNKHKQTKTEETTLVDREVMCS